MASRNTADGHCGICGDEVRAGEGIVDTSVVGKWWQILCVEHMPANSLRVAKRPEASKLPSIHPSRDEGPTG